MNGTYGLFRFAIRRDCRNFAVGLASVCSCPVLYVGLLCPEEGSRPTKRNGDRMQQRTVIDEVVIEKKYILWNYPKTR